MKRRKIQWLGLSLLAAALPALASDGRIEINLAKVMAGGVTPGDAPGFPAQITLPGSYVLTSDLYLTVAPSPENTTGIQVDVDSVTIDLNGFSIRGATTCTGQGSTLSCAPLGSGKGVLSFGPRTTVRNGVIFGTGSSCVEIDPVQGPGAVAEDLNLYSCGGLGIDMSGDVRRVRAAGNFGVGIRSREGVIEGCSALWNRFDGILAADTAVVSGNVARENGTAGIFAANSVVVDNLAQSNEGYEFALNFTGWRGNAALSCGALACQSGPSLQTGINNCDGAPCP